MASEYHVIAGVFQCACGQTHESHTAPVQIGTTLYARECLPDFDVTIDPHECRSPEEEAYLNTLSRTLAESAATELAEYQPERMEDFLNYLRIR